MSDWFFSSLQILIVFLIACGFIVFKYGFRRGVRLRAILRLLFPARIWINASSLRDIQYFLVNMLVFSGVFGSFTFTIEIISPWLYQRLVDFSGVPAPTTLSATWCAVIVTAVLYLSYELIYWLNHYLSHRIPFLWEFHKVHHSATTLTPLSNYRVHPVYAIIFTNAVAVFVGMAHAATHYILGVDVGLTAYAMALYVYMTLYGHLQHSQLWIPFTGIAGYIFHSPAHHQIHHSTNPAHFNKNFGDSLVIFDWLFGTLYIPSRHPEKLVLGTDGDVHTQNLTKSLFYPFYLSWKHLCNYVRNLQSQISGLPLNQHAPLTQQIENRP